MNAATASLRQYSFGNVDTPRPSRFSGTGGQFF